MAITREQKKEMLSELDQVFADSQSIAFVQFDGLGVEDTTAMRSQLREEGVLYKVVKKTLLGRTIESVFGGDAPELEGSIAIAYSSDDPTSPLRGVYEFSKKFKDNVTLVGGVFEGTLKNQDEIQEIATIPSLDVLRGMFVNVLNSPIQRTAIVLDQIAQSKA